MIIAYVPDLMDRSKVAAVAASAVFVASVDALSDPACVRDARVVIVDLDRAGSLEAVASLRAAGVDVVGFASHVRRDLLEAARDAGCTVALPRSRFFAGLPDLLGNQAR